MSSVPLPRPIGQQARRLTGVGEPRGLLIEGAQAGVDDHEAGTDLDRGGEKIEERGFLGGDVGQADAAGEEKDHYRDRHEQAHASAPESGTGSGIRGGKASVVIARTRMRRVGCRPRRLAPIFHSAYTERG
jgi:hypothetical protein